ncbi:MAG: hypothetical protein DRP86_04480 [Candidatus Neomarinimicrobiota bacterium]|nr:MAG: hypothetical protein DRP86_04480 [Candidatus Neomarinimicrobiota bacterium]
MNIIAYNFFVIRIPFVCHLFSMDKLRDSVLEKELFIHKNKRDRPDLFCLDMFCKSYWILNM